MEKEAKNTLFFSLYNRIHASIFSFVFIIVHDWDDAEDILQETATIMWEKFDQFEQGTNFEAWAMSIAHKKALEFLRKNKKSRMVFSDYYYELISKYAQENTKDISEHTHVVKECLKKLSEKDLALLYMRFKQDLPIKQISLSIGRSASGICQSMARILELLRLCVMKTLARQEI